MLKASVIQLTGAFCNDMYYTKYVSWNGFAEKNLPDDKDIQNAVEFVKDL